MHKRRLSGRHTRTVAVAPKENTVVAVQARHNWPPAFDLKATGILQDTMIIQ